MAKTVHFRVTDVREETADVKTFLLQPKNNAPFFYEAGQFLTFIFQHHGHEIRRSYSISSSPHVAESVSITVKREPNGIISRWMFEYLQPGTELEALEPSGIFVLKPGSGKPRDIFLIAAGSGITPVFSILKSALATEPSANVTLIYSNHQPQTTIFYQSLEQLANAYKNQLTIIFLFSNHQNVLKARLSVSSLEMLLQEHLTYKKEDALIYTCGPELFMSMVQIVALTNGFSANHIRKEIFSFDTDIKIARPYFDETDRNITIQYLGGSHQLLVLYNQSILSAALDAGIQLAYNCKSGKCSACMAKCTSGKVWMHYNEVLLPEDEASGLVLTCTGHPASDGVVISV